jgi:hypothetical protein
MAAMTRNQALALLGVLGVLAAIAVPELGSGAVAFARASTDHGGLFGPLVRAAGGTWDLGILRAPAALAMLVLAVIAIIVLLAPGRWRRPLLIVATVGTCLALLVPGVLLQVGLRDAAGAWTWDNDSTYQIEIAGDLLRRGTNPYGHDYGTTGLVIFYRGPAGVDVAANGRPVALDHYPYFPGMLVAAAAWHALPAPVADFRLLVLLATLGLLPAALLLPGPLALRLAAGAVLAANPLLVRGAWTGTADALPVLALVLAFALLNRRRFTEAAVLVVLAALFKQFALVAVPFVALGIYQAAGRAALVRATAIAGGVLVVALLPFLLWAPGAFIDDAIAFGASTYRVVGYGVSGLLVRLHLVDRTGSYPFLPIALVTWVPATVALLVAQRRLREPWLAAVGFGISMLILAEIARVFQTSYLVYPLAATVVGAAIAVGSREGREIAN